MLIKRVTIQGFKTFATRTEFLFDPGVTAIVGPNGSGKSNVVDAIRWCLGEQSFSLLRSKKTGDVIFAGSDQRSRLGMAEVRLVLDNSGGELPIDFAEIEIARRAYRDGDNEYLLNSKRVRLTDINNLLAQTGLGRRTYALIGQGLIDRVLSIAPEELRSLFEEAAGITAYQSKRVATLRQLDAAQSNLLRVQDVLGELTPRLTTLRRQAKRAQEREEIARELQVLLRDWYGYHWHRTKRDLEQHGLKSSEQQTSVQALQKQLEELDARIASVRTKQNQFRISLSEMHRKSSDLHRSAELHGKQLAVTQESVRRLRERREEYTQELAPLHQRQETLHSRIQQLQGEISEAEHGLEKLISSATEVHRKVEENRKRRSQRLDELASARESVTNLRSLISAADARIDQLRDRHKALQNEIAAQEAQMSKTGARVEELATSVDNARAELDRTAQTIQQQERELESIEQQTVALEARMADHNILMQQCERKQEKLLNRQELLQRLRSEGAGYASGVRAVLQSASAEGDESKYGKDRLPGILGTVASLIYVPEQLEKALEIALGAAYQNIVVTQWVEAKLAIDFLHASGRGRATFLPLDRLYVPNQIAAPTQKGVLGSAAQLIRCEPHVKKVIENLLNRTWIVEDLDAARAALDTISRGPRPTVVTLSGEIVRPGGAVTGGSDHSRRDDSIFARERELRQLPEQLRQVAAEQSSLANQSENLQAQIAEIRAESGPVAAELAILRTTLGHRRDKLERQKNLQAQAQQASAWSRTRLSELNNEILAVQQTIAASEAERADLMRASEEAESNLRQLDELSPQTDHDQLLAKLTEERTKVAKAEADLNAKYAWLREQEAALQTVVKQIQAKQEQIRSADDEEKRLLTLLAEATQQEQEVSRNITLLQAEIAPLESELQRLESTQSAAEGEERQLQEELRAQESAWNAAELRFQRTQDAQENLRKNIENDLGLVFWEMANEDEVQPPLPWATIVQQLPQIEELPEKTDEAVRELRRRLAKVTNVNLDAPREYREVASRHELLTSESDDLEEAIADLRKVLRELDVIMETELERTFAAVAEQFVHFFTTLFRGGSARLVLAEPDDISNSGIEIIARPPGKRPQTLALLSGGERTLTACALIFAILKVSPTPFCVLDEVDAALDEANIDRFRRVLDELCHGTQFILITHNRRTLEGTNAIYGITLGSDGASQVISLRLQGNDILQNGDGPSPSSQQALEQIETVVQM